MSVLKKSKLPVINTLTRKDDTPKVSNASPYTLVFTRMRLSQNRLISDGISASVATFLIFFLTVPLIFSVLGVNSRLYINDSLKRAAVFWYAVKMATVKLFRKARAMLELINARKVNIRLCS